MFKELFIIILFLNSAILVAQNNEPRKLGSFSELSVGDKIIVRLIKSDTESAVISAQGIDQSAVKTEIAGNKLEIKIVGEPFTKKKVIVTINYLKLKSISVTGGADVTTTSLMKTDSLKVDIKSGGMLYLDADIDNLSGKITEGGILSAEGYVKDLEMTISTGASLSAFELECDNCIIKATGGGKAKINVINELNAEAFSKGYISYKGNPAKVNKNASSGGIIDVYQP